MATRADVDRWIANAEDAAPGNITAQIAWLRVKRADYAAKVDAGDYEVTADSADGASSQLRRGISNRENHDAILQAIRKLEALTGVGGKSRGTVLGFRIRGITG